MLNGYIVNNVLVWVSCLNQWIHVCCQNRNVHSVAVLLFLFT